MPKDYDYLAFVVDDVFTKDECEEWIAETEAKGYEEALLNAGGEQQISAPHIRNSKRCIVDSHDKAAMLWSVGQHNAYKLKNMVDFTINEDIFLGYE